MTEQVALRYFIPQSRSTLSLKFLRQMVVPENSTTDMFIGHWDRYDPHRDSQTYMAGHVPDQYSRQSCNL